MAGPRLFGAYLSGLQVATVGSFALASCAVQCLNSCLSFWDCTFKRIRQIEKLASICSLQQLHHVLGGGSSLSLRCGPYLSRSAFALAAA